MVLVLGPRGVLVLTSSQVYATQVAPPHFMGAFTIPKPRGRGTSGAGWLVANVCVRASPITIGGNDMQVHIANILQGMDQPDRDAMRANLKAALTELTMPDRFGKGVDCMLQFLFKRRAVHEGRLPLERT